MLYPLTLGRITHHFADESSRDAAEIIALALDYKMDERVCAETDAAINALLGVSYYLVSKYESKVV